MLAGPAGDANNPVPAGTGSGISSRRARRRTARAAQRQRENPMKILYFDDFKLGVLKGDNTVVDVSAVVQDIPHIGPGDLINGLIERFSSYRGKLEQAAAQGQGVPLSSVRI